MELDWDDRDDVLGRMQDGARAERAESDVATLSCVVSAAGGWSFPLRA